MSAVGPFAVLLLGFTALASAVQRTSRSRGNVTDEKSVMCISLPTSDDPEFIRVLLDNIASFSESSTKVALHLGAASEYSEEQIAQWNSSPNVVVTKERVAVHPFQGSVFYAHVLNAKTLEERWPGHCDHFLMQASNMMWVRPGVEEMVRRNRYAELLPVDKPKPSCLKEEEFYNEIIKRKGKQAWGIPEGAFFPMQLVNDFVKYMDQWLEKRHLNGTYIAGYKCYFEATYLQAYAVNYDENAPRPSETEGTPCFRDMSGGNKKSGFTIPMGEIENVIEGKEKFAQFYAVKRVQRDASHPTTVFIRDMGHKSFSFNEPQVIAEDELHPDIKEVDPASPLTRGNGSGKQETLRKNMRTDLDTSSVEDLAEDMELDEAQAKIAELEEQLKSKNGVLEKKVRDLEALVDRKDKIIEELKAA